MTRELHPGDNEKSIRKALRSECQGMRNMNQVAKSKIQTTRSEKRAVDYGQQRTKMEQ